MKYNLEKYRRRSIRLNGYDYAQAGANFVTIVVQGRECVFGEVADGIMRANDAGQMVYREWLALSARFTEVRLDEFVVMPNHCHGIITIGPSVGATLVVAPGADIVAPGADMVAPKSRAGTSPAPTARRTLGDIVGAFKSITTHAYIQGVKRSGWPPFPDRLWQRNYFEHTIRDGASLGRIREYIINNPMQWELDLENPARPGAQTTGTGNC
jgi:REP element-mobilizing transposase RayT